MMDECDENIDELICSGTGRGAIRAMKEKPMTAADWNAKHPIGTRVLVREWEHDVLFTASKAETYHGGFSSVYCCGTGGLVCDRLLPISAYPGDMYEGKPLKKVEGKKDELYKYLAAERGEA